MQAFDDQRDNIENKFSEIDERWSRVEDAIRIQTQERNQDLADLHQKLNQNSSQNLSFQAKKHRIISRTLNKLQEDASETRQNLDKLFDAEAEFRLQHLDQKNAFIQNYTQGTNAFCNRIQQYSTNRLGDISARLQSLDTANRIATEQTLKQLKEETIAEAQQMFAKEKEKYTTLLQKMTENSLKEMDKLRGMLKDSQKQRQQSENKLKVMIENLMAELESCYQDEAKEGDITYDSLLKLLEESCDRIQEAQLR